MVLRLVIAYPSEIVDHIVHVILVTFSYYLQEEMLEHWSLPVTNVNIVLFSDHFRLPLGSSRSLPVTICKICEFDE